MRALCVGLLAVLAVSGVAGAHPGHGPTDVDISGQAYRPATITVATGDTVFWNWTGADRNHSVTADPGQAESFDSDPGRVPLHPAGDRFAHTFNRVGRFGYHCKVHPDMRGTVVVIDAGAGGDKTAPRITRTRISRGKVLAYRLSEEADLIGWIQRRARGRWRTVRQITHIAARGANSKALPVRRLRPGRYRLKLRAYDLAGNRSRTHVLRLRVR